MTSGKAQYNGQPYFTNPEWSEPLPKFSNKLKEQLKSYFPDKNAKPDPVWGDPADVFVEQILSEALDVIIDVNEARLSLNKQDLRAEALNLLKTLKSTKNKLQRLSPDFDRLLGDEANPEACIDELNKLIPNVETAADTITTLPRLPRPDERQHAIAVEMAARILIVLKEFGIKASVTGSSYFDYTSDAIQILKSIGDEVGLCFSDLTWRNTIQDAKTVTDELNPQAPKIEGASE